MRVLPLLLLAVGFPFGLAAVQTGVIVDEGYTDFFKGKLTHVSLSNSGELGTAPGLTEVAQLAEPSVWKVIDEGDGNFVLGTGNSGKVLRLTLDGEVSELFAPDSLLVRGLARDSKGNLFVATSPNGAIYRLPAAGGKPELFFDPEAVYIWDLAVEEDALWITTGFPAQLLRLPLDGSSEKAEIWFNARDEHLTVLLRREGEWLMGSSPRGIVYAISDKDEARAIFKANEKEIRALGVALDGAILIATYADKPQARPNPETGELPPIVVNASGEEAGVPATPLRNTGGEGYLIRLDPNGVARGEWRSTEGGIFSLAAVGPRHWLLGFSKDGKLFGFADRESWELLQQMPKGGQVSAIMPDLTEEGAYYVFTSNPGVVYRLGGQGETACSFISRTLDARQSVSWGRLETTFAVAGEVKIETRTGLTDEPDSTWGNWMELADGMIASARGRFLQYRLTFPADSKAQFLRARAFHTMPNAAPLVSDVRVLDFGAEVRTAQMNGQMLDFAAAFDDAQLEKFQNGISERVSLERRPEQTLRTLIWRAADPNGDQLAFNVFQKRAEEQNWTIMIRDLIDPVYLFNTAGLVPGQYQFKVVASDAASNAQDQAQSSERVSRIVLLDATPPIVKVIKSPDSGRSIAFEVSSDVSRIVAAQVAIDGGEPISLRPDDGIFDSTTERFQYRLDFVPTGPVSALFEVLDESGNQAAIPVQIPAKS